MEKDYLHLLINEEIYQIPDGSKPEKELVEAKAENMEEHQVQEVENTTEVEPEQSTENSAIETTENAPAPVSKHHESPKIPKIEVGEIEELEFAVFHESTAKEELELIHKIIDACRLEKGTYKIFGDGFDRDVQFKKALVFVNTAKTYYTPIPHEKGFFLCSRPAGVLINDQNQKLQLWNALKEFLEI